MIRGQRVSRGFVLLFVLVALLILGLVSAGLYSASEETLSSGQVMLAQKVAASRAEEGIQQAIANVKAGGVPVSALDPPCTGPTSVLRTGTCGAMVTGGLVQGPDGGTLSEGAGWRYQWWAFRSPLPDGGARDAQMVNVYAEGYWGFGSDSPNFSAAAVEAEIIIPMLPASGPLVNDFDYGVSQPR